MLGTKAANTGYVDGVRLSAAAQGSQIIQFSFPCMRTVNCLPPDSQVPQCCSCAKCQNTAAPFDLFHKVSNKRSVEIKRRRKEDRFSLRAPLIGEGPERPCDCFLAADGE